VRVVPSRCCGIDIPKGSVTAGVLVWGRKESGRCARGPSPRTWRSCRSFASEELAHNGLASARREGRVPRPLVPGLRGLCASDCLLRR
jgi:hypothetical protein